MPNSNWITAQLRHLSYLKSYAGISGAIRLRLAEIFRQTHAQVTIHGTPIALRPRSPDLLVAHDSLGEELEPLQDYLSSDFAGLIIDAGGYIGTTSLKLSKMFPNATIVVIEPSSSNFAVLQRNTASKSSIHTINAALVPESGYEISLNDRGSGQWGFTIVGKPGDRVDAPALERVATVSLKDVFAKFPDLEVGLLKLDIEGAEKALFDDATAELTSIHLIFAELHDRIVEGCSDSFARMSEGRTVKKFDGEKFLSIQPAE